MKKVLVNATFNDAHTGKPRLAGKTYDMPEERIAEIKEVNPNLITVVGVAEGARTHAEELAAAKAEVDTAKAEAEVAKAEADAAKAEAEKANAEVEKLKAELEKAKK